MPSGAELAKKRKKKRTTPRKNGGHRSWDHAPKGYDFGIPYEAMYVSDIEFNENLIAAKIMGCSYGYLHYAPLGVLLPVVALIGLHTDPLKRAFDSFHRWAETSDGDAIEMTMITKEDGGYLLGLSQNYKRFISRARYEHPFYDPLHISIMWVKPIDTRNPFVEKFQEYQSKLIAPFLLDGVTLTNPSLDLSSLSPSNVRPIEGLQAILKFECTVIAEKDVEPNSQAGLVLHVDRSPKSKRSSALKGKNNRADALEFHKDSRAPEAIGRRRRRIIEQHFPVTLARFRDSEYCQSISNGLLQIGWHRWQIEQAACNLVLGRELSPDKRHFESVFRKKLGKTIAAEMHDRFEVADSSDDLEWISEAELSRQARRDSISLLESLGAHEKFQEEKALIAELSRRGLLDDVSAE